MSAHPPKSPGLSIPRRTFIRRAAAFTGAAAAFGVLPRGVFAADNTVKPVLVNSIRSLANPYHATWNQGGQDFAKAVGCDYATLVTEGNSEKGIADIRAILAKTGGNMVLNVDPNDSPDARPIVEACVKAGAFLVTQWNKPADLRPQDFNPDYVAHIHFDGVKYGQATAEALFNAMGGSGGIVGLGGILSNTPAIERKEGLGNALAAHPQVKLLDFQVANWKAADAFNITSSWLTRFGSDIKGIWAANDDMASGVLEALRAEGLAGKIPVTGIDGIKLAIDSIRSGDMVATVSWDPYWQGGMGLSLAYAARSGKIDPAKEPDNHRDYKAKGILVTKDNVEDYYKNFVENTPKIDWNDYWGNLAT
ncbi:MAG: sugar ABC transporter substrate-binding protein [Verrucomicrobia bacterium]|nr:sugar ABC transporter substrate-binding protein [Verrucomicrobiota bacterium]